MAVYKVQAPNKVNSIWTVAKFVQTVRSVLDELDNRTLSDLEIRHFLNICLSHVAYATSESIDSGYYGVLAYAVIDRHLPWTQIDFNKPLNEYIDVQSIPVGDNTYPPAYNNNPFVTELQNNLTLTTDVQTGEPNIFNEAIDVYGANTTKAWYEEFFVPSAVLEDIVDVTIAHKIAYELDYPSSSTLPITFFNSLTKVSFNEINYLRTSANTLAHSGAWCYFGGRLHIYLGSNIANIAIVDNEGTKTDALHFQIGAHRKPVLDDLRDPFDQRSGWYKHIDVPDKHIRVLLIAVQKMCMDKMGKRVGYEMEGVLAQLLGNIAGVQGNNLQIQQANRNKVEQGFQTR